MKPRHLASLFRSGATPAAAGFALAWAGGGCPTDASITKTLDIPLYYTGLTNTAQIRDQKGTPKEYALAREYKVKLPVTLPANGYTWILIE